MKKLCVLFLLVAAVAVISAQQPAKPAAPATPKLPDGNMFVWGDDGPYLGVVAVGITNENLSKFGLKEARGVGIEKVAKDSPAARAGLQDGDVVLRFDGEEVKSVAKLSRLIGETAVDQKVRLTVIRGGEEREITATIGKRTELNLSGLGSIQSFPSMPNMPDFKMPEMKLSDEFFKGQFPQDGNMVWNFASGRRIGIVSEPLTKQLGEYFGVADGKGVLVTEVREGSPAAKAGLKAGDVIVEANSKAVTNAIDLVREINAKKEGDVEITFVRDRNRQTVKITPEQAKDLPTMFQTPEPGTNGLRRTFIVPRTISPSSPSALQQVVPGAISLAQTLRCIL